MYFIHGVPKGEVRGHHGHRQDQQYLVCVRGQVRVKLTGKSFEEEKILRTGDCIFMDQMVWGEQEYMTGDDVLLVLCSTSFNKNDYIYDINEILK
jgi:dTDP-4-dehydrorhamnose 3,5-epimerase-like enzyme